MNEEPTTAQYSARFRFQMIITAVLLISCTGYVIYLETRLPFDYYFMIGVMIVCALFLLHVCLHIAITGYRPRYLRHRQPEDKEFE